MRFWDSSALVPLFLEEAESDSIRERYREDPTLLVWWGSVIECAGAIARREREERIDARTARAARKRLNDLARLWHEVEPTSLVREIALRLLRLHPLRTADSLQLAAAHVGCDRHPSDLEFVCLDTRLGVAAEREGFPVIGAD